MLPANQQLLLRTDAFLGPMGYGWRVLKELAVTFLQAYCNILNLFPESVPPHLQSPRTHRIGQQVVQSTGSSCFFLLTEHTSGQSESWFLMLAYFGRGDLPSKPMSQRKARPSTLVSELKAASSQLRVPFLSPDLWIRS